MNATTQNQFGMKSLTALCLAGAVSLSGYAPLVAAHSDGAAWGIGGLLAGTMLGRATADKQGGEEKHHKSSSSTPSSTPAAPMTAERKIAIVCRPICKGVKPQKNVDR